MKTFKLTSTKNNYTGQERHIIDRIEVRDNQKFIGTVEEHDNLDKAKSRLEYLKVFGNL